MRLISGFSYARFRTTNAFLFGLIGFVLIYLPANMLLGFDPGWGMLNLGLSLEASISVALIMRSDERREARDQAADEHRYTIEQKQEAAQTAMLEAQNSMLKYILDMLEANVTLVDVARATVANTQETKAAVAQTKETVEATAEVVAATKATVESVAPAVVQAARGS